jgi:hypothetical protein
VFGVTVKVAFHWYWLTPLTVIDVLVPVAVFAVQEPPTVPYLTTPVDWAVVVPQLMVADEPTTSVG